MKLKVKNSRKYIKSCLI